MSSQTEYNLESILAAIIRVKQALDDNEKEKAMSRLIDIEDEIRLVLFVMEGYSIEEARERVYS